jgi:hypothetical protein
MTWAELVEMEEHLAANCRNLDRQDSGKSLEKSEAVQHWWACVSAVLWRFTRTMAQQEIVLEPFPLETLARLATLGEDLSNGNIPDFVLDVAAKGKGRPLWTGERYAICFAIRYIDAADRGEIADPSPRKTVRDQYRVTAQTVRNWLDRRDEMCIGVPGADWAPERLTERMVIEGARYSRVGRGAPAG